MVLCLSRRCCHFSRRRAFLWLLCREEAFVKWPYDLQIRHRESAQNTQGGWRRHVFFMCQTVPQKKDSKTFCSVLSSVPFRCLAKAHLASGLHMFLCWYSGSFQHNCLQDTEIVSSYLACVVSALKASQLLCPRTQGFNFSTTAWNLSSLLSWSQNYVALQHSPMQGTAVLPPVGAHKSPTAVIIRVCSLEAASWVRCMLQ